MWDGLPAYKLGVVASVVHQRRNLKMPLFPNFEQLTWQPEGIGLPVGCGEARKSPAGEMPAELFSADSRLTTIASAAIMVAAVVRAQTHGIVIVMVAARIEGRLLSISRTSKAGDSNNGENCIANNLGHFDFSSV
ncbi:hypothetical protein FJ980_22525 [Mesorhizobium sp. B1-1-5]|nr:hypothetical protein FJ980_22525 [Mesorhizobium sp. B1-1-5]